jgi:hypothetical protein
LGKGEHAFEVSFGELAGLETFCATSFISFVESVEFGLVDAALFFVWALWASYESSFLPSDASAFQDLGKASALAEKNMARER